MEYFEVKFMIYEIQILISMSLFSISRTINTQIDQFEIVLWVIYQVLIVIDS